MTSVSIASFQEHADAVYAWAFRILGRHQDALDVVQEVFLRWSGQCQREAPKHPRGWLRRVTLNKAIDLIRSSRIVSVSERANQSADRAPSIGIESCDMDQLRRDVSAALECLTDAQRSVLAAKVFDNMTFAAIAQEQELAVSTVKTHYVRAVGVLREQLRSSWGDALKDGA